MGYEESRRIIKGRPTKRCNRRAARNGYGVAIWLTRRSRLSVEPLGRERASR
jgi:hypothetical protein